MPLTATQLETLSTDLRLACMRISRRVRYESPSEIAPHQFSVLVRLEEQPRTPRELAKIERVSAPSMTRTTTQLCERGLVSRAGDPDDGRSVIFSLTPQGRQAVVETRRRRDLWMTSRISALPVDEQRLLAQAVGILAKVAAE